VVSLIALYFCSWYRHSAFFRDDPVQKYLPEFKYRLNGFNPSSPSKSMGEAPITMFQLASHMSGLGRDWPSGTVANWPKDMFGGGPPPTNGHPFPSNAALLNAISNTGTISPPFSYPAYSNTGTGLLGLALVAANRAASKNPNIEPTEYAELLKRDLFDPMGLNGSHFLTTEANKHLVVAPSLAPEVVVRPTQFFTSNLT
jgi:CubicO group peptidase (beta-lactamase class C family)